MRSGRKRKASQWHSHGGSKARLFPSLCYCVLFLNRFVSVLSCVLFNTHSTESLWRISFLEGGRPKAKRSSFLFSTSLSSLQFSALCSSVPVGWCLRYSAWSAWEICTDSEPERPEANSYLWSRRWLGRTNFLKNGQREHFCCFRYCLKRKLFRPVWNKFILTTLKHSPCTMTDSEDAVSAYIWRLVRRGKGAGFPGGQATLESLKHQQKGHSHGSSAILLGTKEDLWYIFEW